MINNSLVEGKPYKKIIRFAIPLLIGNLFQQFYNMTDSFIISRTLGMNAFAGVSSTSGIIFLIIGFAQGLTVGLSILISQSFGANDQENVRKNYIHNMIISIVIAVILTIISFTSIKWILNTMKTPNDIWLYAHDYLQIMFASIITSMMFNFFSNSIKALGDSKTPLIYLFIASIINIILDILLINILNLGVKGAAYATVIAQVISAVLCALTIKNKYTIFSRKKESMKLESKIFISNLKIGLPIAFQSSIIALGVIIVQFATNNMGTIAVASYAVAGKIDGIAVEPLRSFGMSMTTFTAQNYGAKKYKRIIDGVHQCIFITILLSVVLGLIMYQNGRYITALFIGFEQNEVLTLSHTFLTIHGFLYILLALLFIFRYVLQGLGKSIVPTIAGIMELIMRFLSAIFLIPHFGFIGASIATPFSWLGALIPVFIAYNYYAKRLKKLIKDWK